MMKEMAKGLWLLLSTSVLAVVFVLLLIAGTLGAFPIKELEAPNGR